MPSLRRKLFSGTSYTLVSILSVQAISLITSVIYARVLGRETLGILAVFIQLSAAIVPLSNLGLGTVIAKLIPEYRRKNQAELEEVLSTSLVVSVVAGAIVSAAFFLVADYLASLYGVPEFVLLIQISAGLIVFDSLLTLGGAVIQGFQRVKELAILGIVAKAATVPVIFYLTVLLGLLGAVLAGAISLAINLGIYFVAVRKITREERTRISWRKSRLRTGTKILRLALPLLASFIVLRPALLFQTSFLALSEGYGEAGLFRVASSLYRIVLMLPASLSVPLLPAISEMYAAGDPARTKRQLSAIIRVMAFLSLPVTLAMGLGSGPVIEFLFGPEYLAASTLVFVISAAAFVDAIVSPASDALLGTGRTIHVLMLTGMQAVLVAGTTYLFVTIFGLMGIGYAMLTTALIYDAVVFAYFRGRGEILLGELLPGLILGLAAFTAATVIVFLGGLNNVFVLAAFLGSLLLVEYRLLTDRDRFVLRDSIRGILGE